MNLRTVLAVYVLFSLALIYLLYGGVDIAVTREMIRLNDTWVNRLSNIVSVAGESTWWLIGSALLWLFWRFARPRPAAASRAGFLFTAVAFSGIIVLLLKMLFAKARPILLKNDDIYGFTWLHVHPDYNSFPSGHTTTAFTVATVFALMFPRYTLPIYLTALFVGLSRIGNWWHYPSDVVAGALCGVLCTLLLFNFDKISFKNR